MTAVTKKRQRSFLRRGGRSPEEKAAVEALRATARDMEARLAATIPYHHTMVEAREIAGRAHAAMLRLRDGQTRPASLPQAILIGLQALEEWRALLFSGWEEFDANAPPWAQRSATAQGAEPAGQAATNREPPEISAGPGVIR